MGHLFPGKLVYEWFHFFQIPSDISYQKPILSTPRGSWSSLDGVGAYTDIAVMMAYM